MKTVLSVLIILSFTIIFLNGCADDNTQTPPPLIDENNNGFATFEVAKIFAENCTDAECHSGTAPQHGLNLTSYSEMLKGSNGRDLDSSTHNHPKANHVTVYGGEAVIPFDAEHSLLYNLITGNIEDQSLRMPYGRAPLSDDQIEIIKNWINNGAKDNNGNIPFSSAGDNVYICCQGSDQIYEIDKNYQLVSRIINVDYNATPDAPHNIQMFGDYVYVSLISTGRLLKINKNTNAIVGYAEGIERAGMINISPDGKTAYVSRSSTSPGIYNSIYAVNTETMQVIGELTIPVTGVPHAIALTSDGAKIYVANMNKDRISIIDAHSFELIGDDIVLSNGGSLVHEPMHIYLSPDDKYLYLNCRTSSKMLIIDTQSRTVVKEIDIDNHPMQSAISSDGNKIYTVSHHEPVITEITKSGNDWIITNKLRSEIFHHLYGAALSSDDRYLYVTCSNSEDDFKPHYKIPGKDRPALLCIYDTSTNELVKIIDIGSYATGVAAH